MKVQLNLVLTAILALSFQACSTKQEVKELVLEKSYVIADPGAVEYIYEPPMVDVMEVPPGLDPEGHYYRPSHQEIVEIRPGRWQYYKEK